MSKHAAERDFDVLRLDCGPVEPLDDDERCVDRYQLDLHLPRLLDLSQMAEVGGEVSARRIDRSGAAC